MGFRQVQLTEFAIRVGAGGVEVAQRDVPDPMGRLGIPEHALDRELGVAVGVDRVLRGRLGEHDVPAFEGGAGLEQLCRSADVVLRGRARPFRTGR